MPFAPLNVANNILNRSLEGNARRPVTPAQLQRLLWLTAAEYQHVTEEVLLNERFERWDRGPVIRSVHWMFRCYGATAIKKYAKDAAGNAHVMDEDQVWPLQMVMDKVWDRASSHPERILSEVVTWPGSAWWKAKESGQAFIDNAAVGTDTSYRRMLGLSDEGAAAGR